MVDCARMGIVLRFCIFKEGIWLIVPDYFFKFEGGVRGCVSEW